MEKFEPELNLSEQEIVVLASVIQHPGFQVIKKIGKSVVDQFVVNWINAENDEDVLRVHKYAKVSAQVWTMLLGRISQEASDFITNYKEENKPIDAGAGLDFGENAPYELEEELINE